MVASIWVLGGREGRGSVADIAKYFTEQATGDYYTGSGEPPGLWFGEGAKVLGLQGTVTYEALVAVLSGERPVGGGRLVRKPRRSKRSANAPVDDGKATQKNAKSRRRREWVPGFDLTLSVPKSVSGLWAVAPPDARSEIDQAIDQAARQTLAWLEQSVPLTRRGVGGFSEERARLVVAMFHHTVPRNFVEPQRHVHCLIGNACCRADGSWATIHSRALLNWTRTVGPVFRANLAAELKGRLGLELIRPVGTKQKLASWFEVDGVPATLLSQWSSRSGQIDELLEGIGAKTGNNTPAARQRANVLTRKAKTAMPRREDLFRQWQQEAAKHGFGEEQAQRLVDRSRPADFEKAYRHAWQQGLRELTREQAHFAARQVIQHVCEALQDQGVSGTRVAERVCTDLERSKQVIALDKYRGEMRFTTQQIWRGEENLLGDVKALSKNRGAVVSAQSAKQVIEANPSLTDEQAVAANLLLTAESAIRVLTGVAGAGKSRTLGAVREGLEQAGYRVIGGAVAGAAKEELAVKTGIEARTLASYFFHWDGIVPESARQGRTENRQSDDACKSKLSSANAVKLDDRTVIIIDEAGQLDTRSAARLVDHVKQAGATLILTGDESQLPPILAGAPLRRIAQEVPSAHLKENLRQKGAPEDLAAANDIRCGDALKALESYAQRGRLTIAKDRKETLRQLVATWAKEGGIQSPQEAIIFTQTRLEASVANRLCQAERQIAGTVSTRGLQVGSHRVCEGDRVLFHTALCRHGVENGFRGTVVGVDSVLGNMTVRLDHEPSPQARAKGHRQTITVPVRELSPETLTLAYAATTHKMQGQSISKAYVLLGGAMTDMQMSYVQTTRGQDCTRIFVDELHAGESLQDLARSMSRSRAKDLAHDVMRQGRQPARLEHRLQHEPH